ncbi:hypothetical protein FQN57_004850 [Myotisia sp. PD_48]|nr:hypothetical protein FQN57_004850 [Myotisia sp. PD_48]
MPQTNEENDVSPSTGLTESYPKSESDAPAPAPAGDGPLELEEGGREREKPNLKKSRTFNLAFVGLAFTVFVFHLDATTLGVALPAIATELHGTSLESFWANISYTLCVVITQPLWASISNALGRKPPLYVSMVLFAVGSLAFALAKNMATVITGRVLQGLGGGGLDVLAEIILADMTTLQERSFYLGLMALPISIGNILGPSIGAVFSTYASWRWIGWVNLPILGAATPLVIFCLRLRKVNLETSLVDKLKRLDWIGMVLFVIGITIFVLPLSWAGALYSWTSWRTLLPLLLGVAMLAVFAVYEANPQEPIVPHRLFSSKTANMTLLGGFMHGMILFSILLYLPLFYQAIELQTVIGSAVSLLPTSVVSVAVAAGSMMAVAVFGGGYRWVLRLSWVMLVVGTGILVLLNLDSSSSMRLGLPILWGAGVAMLRLLLLPMQASVKDVNDTSLAIGQLLTIRLLGGLVGLAIAATIFSTVFAASIASIELLGPLQPLSDPNNAVAFISELRRLNIPPDLLNPVLRAYLKAFQTIFYTMTAFAGLGFLTSLFTDDLELNRTDLGQQQFEER